MIEMKHGRKANWTRAALDYYNVTMERARMAGQAVKIMEERED